MCIEARYAYVRVAFRDPLTGAEVTAGIEVNRHTEDVDGDYKIVYDCLEPVINWWETDDQIAEAIERAIRASWKERSYFIEVGRHGDRWVQVFEPKAQAHA